MAFSLLSNVGMAEEVGCESAMAERGEGATASAEATAALLRRTTTQTDGAHDDGEFGDGMGAEGEAELQRNQHALKRA